MKNIYKILSIVVLAFTANSCGADYLDLQPISSVGQSDFYTNDEEVLAGVIGMYDGLQAVPLREFALTEMRSDNAKSKSKEGDWAQFELFNVLPTNLVTVDYWRANYNVIFRANLVLKNINVVTNAANKAKYDAEARFVRALVNFNLVRAFGAIPLLDKTVNPVDADYDSYLSKKSADVVLDFIEKDLEIAVANLPIKSATFFGRATKGAAQGMLAKVYLTRHKYSKALPLLNDLVSNKNYALQEDYADVFYSEGNSEILFAIPYLNDDINESQDFSFEMTVGGRVSGLDYVTDDLAENIDDLDTERLPVLINPKDTNANGKFLSNSGNARLCGNDWIVLRFADVLLMHAECLMEGGINTASVDAIKSYNKVRARVSLSTLKEDGTATLTKLALRRERRIELAFENHRLYDLIRFGDAKDILTQYAIGTGTTFSQTDLLLPIPQAEINVSKGLLLQNLGY